MKITLDMIAEVSTAIYRTMDVRADMAAAEIIAAAVAPLILEEAAKVVDDYDPATNDVQTTAYGAKAEIAAAIRALASEPQKAPETAQREN